MTPFRRRLRKLRFFVQAAFVTVVISMAVIVALAQMALPWLAGDPGRVERWLSARLNREVSIGHLSGTWTQAGPRLVFDDLRIGATESGEGGLRLPRSELAVNLFAAFQKDLAWNEFRVVGLDLALQRTAEGVWKLRGLDLDENASGATSMGSLGAVVLVDMKLAVVDTSHGIDFDLRVPELRVVNEGRITRVLGQLGTANSESSPLWLVVDIDGADKSGRLYVGGNNLDIAELARGHAPGGIGVVAARGDVQFWASWREGLLNGTELKLAIGQTVLEAKTPIQASDSVAVIPRSSFDDLAFSARWRRQPQGWRFDLADFTVTVQGVTAPPGRLIAEFTDAEPASTQVQANALELGGFGTLAMLGEVAPERLRRWLYLANPHGRIDALDLRWHSDTDFDIDALILDMASHQAGMIPGIEPLSARLRGDAQALWLQVPEQATRIDYRAVFRKPFALNRLSGDVVAWRDAQDWQVQTSALDLAGDGYSVSLRGGAELQGDGSRPLLDVAALVTQGNVDTAKMFWPMTTMPPNVIEWLDDALVAGRISEGRALVRGDLDNWPFDDNSGRFDARAELEDLKLAFLPDWPSGEHLDVSARFINNGMQATAHGGTSMAIAIDGVDATIADFREPVLELSVDGNANGRDLLPYLRATPVGEDHIEYLRGLGIGGRGVVHIDLDVPLRHHEDATLDGYVDLKAADLDERTWDLHFKQASGRVRFSRDGVLADALATRYEDLPVSLSIAIGSSASDAENSFEARLRGVLPASSVFARASDLAPALANFPGQAEWDIDLAIGSEQGPARGRRILRLQSTLEGIAINLPAPLQKSAQARLPFALSLAMPPLGQPFTASLGDILQIEGRLPGPDSTLAARLELGRSAASGELPASGLFIGGHAATFDAGGWIGLFSAGGGSSDLLRGMDLKIDDLRMAGRSFPNLHVTLAPDGEMMKIGIAGDLLQGDLSIPRVDLRRRGITAQMSRVNWPDAQADEPEGAANLTNVDPASIPPLHLWIGQLQLGESELGEARLETYPGSAGMHIDLLETRSPNLDLRASGVWSGNEAANRSQMAIDMTAESLGSMLDTFGFVGIIEDGQTVAHIEAHWPGSPVAFALADITGSLDISVQEGRILDVEPGAGGRLFGLLSLREIPRRLSLDFSDLFKTGMSFNSITGQFTLADGNAKTENLHIVSPPADITISGRTGLRHKDYDQEMVVTPRAGVALPVVGALAGGPVGAAAGLVVQTLIGKSINRAARSRYRVTGSWEKPVITLVGKEKIGDESDPPATRGAAGGDASTSLDPPIAPIDPVQAVIDAIPARMPPDPQGQHGAAPRPSPAAQSEEVPDAAPSGGQP